MEGRVMILKSIVTILISYFAVATVRGEDLTPTQIMERYMAAQKTLRFSEVAPYVHPRALADYRRTTSAVIRHAVERFGEDAIVAFFQGTTLRRLEASSDADYWAFVMASSMQFSTERPIMAVAPEGEVKQGDKRILLVYPVRASLATAPELGLFNAHTVCTFERDGGVGRMAWYAAPMFEETLYWYLRQNKARG
jgi:hypothetical protein